MAVDYILDGSEHSLFTGKARAYLRYKGLSWEEEQIAIGAKTCWALSTMVPALGIIEVTIRGIRGDLFGFSRPVGSAFSRFNFLLGSRPNIGDFRFMGPLYTHLGPYLVPRALVQERAPHVYARVERPGQLELVVGQMPQ